MVLDNGLSVAHREDNDLFPQRILPTYCNQMMDTGAESGQMTVGDHLIGFPRIRLSIKGIVDQSWDLLSCVVLVGEANGFQAIPQDLVGKVATEGGRMGTQGKMDLTLMALPGMIRHKGMDHEIIEAGILGIDILGQDHGHLHHELTLSIGLEGVLSQGPGIVLPTIPPPERRPSLDRELHLGTLYGNTGITVCPSSKA